jgi:hypothetical protein
MTLIISIIYLMIKNKYLKSSKYSFLVKKGKIKLPAQMVNA